MPVRLVIAITLPDDADTGSVADWFDSVVSRAYPGIEPNATCWEPSDLVADLADIGPSALDL